MAGTEQLRVFISYARRDGAAFAEELLAGLEVAGFDASFDRHDIAAGEDWEARLGGLIQFADTIVFVVSPASAASDRCGWEIERANALSKRIIPVILLEVPEAQTPPSLRRLNYIYFTEGDSFSRSLGDLAKALRIDLDWIREHTRLNELATRWRARDRVDVLLLRGSELEAAKAWLASWKAPAPEPSDLHRALAMPRCLFLRASQKRSALTLKSLTDASSPICSRPPVGRRQSLRRGPDRRAARGMQRFSRNRDQLSNACEGDPGGSVFSRHFF
jgi:hypothetical protein